MTNTKPEVPQTPVRRGLTKRTITYILCGFTIIAVLVVLIVIGSKQARLTNYAVKIDDTAYSKSFINKVVKDGSVQTGYDKAKTNKVVVQYLKERVALQKLGYQLGPDMPESIKNWDDLKANHLAVVSDLEALKSGKSEGWSFVFDFSAKVLPNDSREQPIVGAGDAKAIENDKQYAKQQADKYYKLYTTRKISPEKLYALLKKDTRLNINSGSSQFSSYPGGHKTGDRNQYPDALSFISRQKKPIISEVRVGSYNVGVSRLQPDFKEAYYYFVDLKRVDPAVPNPSKNLEVAISKLKVKTNEN